MQDILKSKEKLDGTEAFQKAVLHLIEGEDLQLMRLNSTSAKGFMDLQIVSRVTMDSNKPSKLNALCSYVGSRFLMSPSNYNSQPFMNVFAGSGISMLWWPEWDKPSDLVQDVKATLNGELGMQSWFASTNTLELKCFMKSGSVEQVLLQAYPWEPPHPVPDFAFLNRIQTFRQISGNDWHRLFTNIKPAHSGYYFIDAHGATNLPPFFVQGTTNWETGNVPSPVREAFQKDLRNARSRLAKREKPSLSIDGSFDDWQHYKKAWAGPGEKFNEVKSGGKNDTVFEMTACCFSNDRNYLYLFLKFQPSVQERFERLNSSGKLQSIGNVGSFYFDEDMDRSTGAKEPQVKPPLVGSDLMISVGAGAFRTPASVSAWVGYSIFRYDASLQDLTDPIEDQSSRSDPLLIKDGKDGVEMAVPLDQIHTKKGTFRVVFESEFSFLGSREVFVTLE